MAEIERIALVKLNTQAVKTAMEVAVLLRDKQAIDKEMNFAAKAINELRGNTIDECGDNHTPDTIAVIEFFRDVVYPGILERTKSYQMCADRSEAEAAGKIAVSSNMKH